MKRFQIFRRLTTAFLLVIVFFSCALFAFSIIYARQQSAELGIFIEKKSADYADRAQDIITSVRNRVLLHSARLSAGLPNLMDERSHQESIYVLSRVSAQSGDFYKIVRESPGRSYDARGPDFKFSAHDTAVEAGSPAGILLWPQPIPLGILACAPSTNEFVVCGELRFNEIVQEISKSAVLVDAFQLSDESGLVLAQTQSYDTTVWELIGKSPVIAGENLLTLSIHAGPKGKEAFGTPYGYLLPCVVAAGMIIFSFAFLKSNRDELRQLALSRAVLKSRADAGILCLTTMRNIAESTGILIWFAKEDGTMEIMGPWADVIETDLTTITFEQAVSKIENSEEVLLSLKSSIKTKKPWSSVVVTNNNGVREVYQTTSAPLFDASGVFLGLTGVSLNITDALSRQTSSMLSETVRRC